jgi:hypothetical protein
MKMETPERIKQIIKRLKNYKNRPFPFTNDEEETLVIEVTHHFFGCVEDDVEFLLQRCSRLERMYEHKKSSSEFWERKYIEERNKFHEHLHDEMLKSLVVDEDGILVEPSELCPRCKVRQKHEQINLCVTCFTSNA